MRDGLTTQPTAGVAPVVLAAHRKTIDRPRGDVVSLKVTHSAITDVGYLLLPVARAWMISEVC
ncbi:hypothetical protein TX25_25705 [Pseudomonas lactis]|nr:hypothetical protein TX25_25705 [Pseudomonas lactis]